MECIHHHEREATARCTNCGAYICNDCTCYLNGAKVCPSCFQTACNQNIAAWKKAFSIQFIYMGIALILYLAGVIVMFTLIEKSIGYLFLGLLLMGLPNVYCCFNKGVGIIATPNMWFWIYLIEFLLGIVLTPVIAIISIIRGLKYKKEEKAWEKNLEQINTYINSLQ